MTTTTPPLSVDTLNVAARPDATEVYGWTTSTHPDGLAARVFDATVRECAGFRIRVHGLQRANGSCRRWATVEPQPGADEEMLEPEAVRQLAAALMAAADEIEARR